MSERDSERHSERDIADLDFPDYDIADSERTDGFTRSLRAQPLMEARAWHGWAGMIEAGWVMMVAGPTRHMAMPKVYDLTHRWSWPFEPTDAERDARLSQTAVGE